jgi:hypothetical protein
VLSGEIFAQITQDMYDSKVIEIKNLKDSLNNLKDEFEAKVNQINDLQQQVGLMKDEILKSNSLKNENKKLVNDLKLARRDSLEIEEYKDSIISLNQTFLDEIEGYRDSINSLNKSLLISHEEVSKLANQLEQKEDLVSNYKIKVGKYNSISSHLEKISRKTVDVLYKESSLEQLLFCKELYLLLGKSLPSVVTQTIECFEAQKQCSVMYDGEKVQLYCNRLSRHNTNVSRTILSRLKRYSTICVEADALWISIKNEVCNSEIANESFPQIAAKRQIWQRVQKFFDKYPKLSEEYPYIYAELQGMLRDIWKNANNFNQIDNPFD